MTSQNLESHHKPGRVVILSGLSGSGKSTAIHALEDIGYFCIDNLPIVLLPKLVELFPQSSGAIEQIALVVDAREGRFLESFPDVIRRIRTDGSRVEVLFLDCADRVLLRRYNETRRRHPLAPLGSIEEGIRIEREMTQDLRGVADQVVDTTDLNPHQLRQLIKEHFTQIHQGYEMAVTLVSFGYRLGIPAQSDLVLDARFLPNPYFDPALQELDGTNPQVAAFVLQSEEGIKFLDQVCNFITTFRPYYEREGKSYLTVAIGCTGGRHRSVAVVEELGKRMRMSGKIVRIRHRDLGCPPETKD